MSLEVRSVFSSNETKLEEIDLEEDFILGVSLPSLSSHLQIEYAKTNHIVVESSPGTELKCA